MVSLKALSLTAIYAISFQLSCSAFAVIDEEQGNICAKIDNEIEKINVQVTNLDGASKDETPVEQEVNRKYHDVVQKCYKQQDLGICQVLQDVKSANPYGFTRAGCKKKEAPTS